MFQENQCPLDPHAETRLAELLELHCAGEWRVVLRPCAPRLVSLLLSKAQEPVDLLDAAVRLVLAEQINAGECGDDCDLDPHDLHRLVRQVLAAMNELQHERTGRDQFHHADVPPIMYG